jgi:serine/threonine-protein kinase RsbW
MQQKMAGIMDSIKAQTVSVKFPGDLDYIPSIRKYVSELLQVNNFNQKFAFRTEIIVDEICNNAVTYGCHSSESHVELSCDIFTDRVEFIIKDQGGQRENIDKLRTVMNRQDAHSKDAADDAQCFDKSGLGLEIVRMLAEEVNLEIDENNLTSLRVVRRRGQEDYDMSKTIG